MLHILDRNFIELSEFTMHQNLEIPVRPFELLPTSSKTHDRTRGSAFPVDVLSPAGLHEISSLLHHYVP